MNPKRFVLTVLLAALAQLGFAFAQNPLVGQYLETQIGFVVVFEQEAGGPLTGTLYGASGGMPLDIQADTQNVQGSFMLEGMPYGFAAQLQADNQTLFIWLYQFDASGQPIQSSYEQYTANRSAEPLVPSQPPQVAPPAESVGPGLGGVDKPQMPVTPVEPQAPALPVQPVAPPPLSQNSIVGTWQGTIVAGGLSFIGNSTFGADGTFYEELLLDGQQVGWFGGTYTFADGVMVQTGNSGSEQICIQGQCQPNDTTSVSTSTITWTGPDSFTLTSVPSDPAEAVLQVNMQRVMNPPAGDQAP